MHTLENNADIYGAHLAMHIYILQSMQIGLPEVTPLSNFMHTTRISSAALQMQHELSKKKFTRNTPVIYFVRFIGYFREMPEAKLHQIATIWGSISQQKFLKTFA